jgi:ABC-type multidrug transport system fused ATPase/permease subunit
MLAAIDWRIGLALLLWLAGYVVMIRWFLPRIRVRSKARAAARANVTGQIVDTITNIKTVKLFGHTEHEDEAAIDALQGYRQTALAFGYLSTGLSVRPDGDGGAVARGSGAGSDRAVAERAWPRRARSRRRAPSPCGSRR